MNRLFPALALLLVPVLLAQAQNTEPAPPTTTEAQAAGTQTRPHTEIVPETATAPDSILDHGPLPSKPMNLIGGTVKKVDAVRNRVLIQPSAVAKMRTFCSTIAPTSIATALLQPCSASIAATVSMWIR